jgi:hypothetical protein
LRVLDALGQRDFRLLFGGQTISQIGDAAFVVALSWRAFTLTHEASSLGIVLLVDAAAVVATPARSAASWPTATRGGRCWSSRTSPARSWSPAWPSSMPRVTSASAS